MKTKAFFINGGAGRVICSIPALTKYYEETSKDFIIVCEGGMDFYKKHPILHELAYDVMHKDLFRDKIKDCEIVTPEPYRVWEYFNQKCNLTQAFDIAINNKGIRDLGKPDIHLTQSEIINGKITIKEVKEKSNAEKILVFQPFGRGIQAMENFVTDPTGRSFEYSNMVSIIKKLQDKGYGIILMTEMNFDLQKEGCKPVAQPQSIDLRHWSGIIKESDYFLGCDSVGQHISYVFDVPTTVVVGSTFAENITYPNDSKFNIQDMGEGKRVYDPIRIVLDDFANKNNDGIMAMNGLIEDVIVKELEANYKKHNKKTKTPAIDNGNISKLIPGSNSLTQEQKNG